MTETNLKDRTKAFALRVIRMFSELPHNQVGYILGKQVLRSGTSVGANYREASRARSEAEFLSKVEICLQEIDETCYWLELLIEGEVFPSARLQPLLAEANELLAIFVASVQTLKRRLRPC